MPQTPITTRLPLSQDVLWILLSLTADEQHGYAIIREVEARSEGAVRLQTGALYRNLKRMLGDRLVEERDAPAEDATNGPRRRYYRLTAFGRAVLEAELERMAALVRVGRQGLKAHRTRLA